MLLEGHFQNAYICDDIEAGIALLRNRGPMREPQVFTIEQPVDAPTGEVVNVMRLCFIWIGELQYELIQPIADPLGVYANCRSNGGPLRFHHICMRVPDWSSFREKAGKQDLPIVFERDLGEGQTKFLYLDARAQLGHYLEYVWMSEESWAVNRSL